MLQFSCGEEGVSNQYALQQWDVPTTWCLGLELLVEQLTDLLMGTPL